MRLNSLFVSMFGGTYCSSESITRCFILAHIPRQKSLVVCGSAFVNRITDCSVHPRFLIWKGPYSYRFCSLFGKCIYKVYLSVTRSLVSICMPQGCDGVQVVALSIGPLCRHDITRSDRQIGNVTVPYVTLIP